MPPQDLDETTFGAAIVDTPRTVWPAVLGTLAVLLALLILVQHAPDLRDALVGRAPASQPAASQPSAAMQAIRGTNQGVIVALTVWLLWAGIGLIRRRPWSGKSMLNWALSKITWIGINTALMLSVMLQERQRMPASRNWPPVAFAVVATITMLVLALPALAPAIFVAIWFRRARIKAEVATWT